MLVTVELLPGGGEGEGVGCWGLHWDGVNKKDLLICSLFASDGVSVVEGD